MRVGMAEVLAEAFGEFEAGKLAGLCRPGVHALEIFINTMLFPEPFALGFVGGQRLGLALHDIGDINQEGRLHRLAVDPDTLHSIDVVVYSEGVKSFHQSCVLLVGLFSFFLG